MILNARRIPFPDWGEKDSHRMTWNRKAVSVLAVADAICVLAAMIIGQLIRFSSMFSNNAPVLPVRGPEESISYWGLSLLLAVIWWVALWMGGARNPRILGAGPDEYRYLIRSSLAVFGALAIIAYAFGIELARGYLLIAAPVGIALLMIERWIFRVWLVRRRHRGRALIRVLVLGDRSSSGHLVETLHAARNFGYTPVAAYLTGPADEPHDIPGYPGFPVAGQGTDPDQIMEVVRELHIDHVALSTGHLIIPQDMRRLGWLLAEEHVGLAMAPALTDIAGPRFHTQPLNGLPLIHVSTPRMRGPAAVMKRSLDIVATLVGLLVISPLMLLIALAVKIDSPGGPILFHQERVGYRGERFKMHKFRSMVPNAEQLKAQLLAQNEGNGVLFKMADDPRITRVGRFLRRYSLDELPQLWNVLVGQMSLVGPRPPLPAEVEQYEEDVHRRLLVKPGITGLWQVSGRSDLSWEDTKRLDLYYVENWSVIGDALILLKTARAVVGSDGAY